MIFPRYIGDCNVPCSLVSGPCGQRYIAELGFRYNKVVDFGFRYNKIVDLAKVMVNNRMT